MPLSEDPFLPLQPTGAPSPLRCAPPAGLWWARLEGMPDLLGDLTLLTHSSSVCPARRWSRRLCWLLISPLACGMVGLGHSTSGCLPDVSLRQNCRDY